MIKSIAIIILLAIATIFPVTSLAMPSHPEIQIKIKAIGTPKQISRITRLSEIARLVVNSLEFEKRVKGAYFKKGKSFSYSNETGEQVFQTMVNGAELDGEVDNIWNLSYIFEAQKRICFFRKCSSWVYGWTTPKIQDVYINSLPWETRDDCGIVGTIVHEELHKLGLSHPSEFTSTRYLSPPYAIGTIAAEICKKFI